MDGHAREGAVSYALELGGQGDRTEFGLLFAREPVHRDHGLATYGLGDQEVGIRARGTRVLSHDRGIFA